MLQLADGLGFDLADALAGDLEDVADFFQRVAVAVAQAVAELDDLAFAVAERLEHLGDPAAEHFLRGADGRAFGRAVGQQVAEVAVFAVADRPVEADRVAAHRQHAAGFVDRASRPRGPFLRSSARGRALAAACRETLRTRRHGFDHVDRNADRAALVGHGAGDRLANPPRGVGAELEAAAIFELVDRPHQAGVAFLDQVQEATGRGCDTSWRSRRPAAGCLPTDRAWPVDIRCRPACSLRDAIAQAGRRFLRGPQDVADIR